MYYWSSSEHYFQPQEELETIPEEEEPQMEEKQDIANQDTVVFTPDESEEEPFNTAIDDTSDLDQLIKYSPMKLSSFLQTERNEVTIVHTLTRVDYLRIK